MYVCMCHAVTEAQVKHEIDAGAVTPRQIAKGCKAGTDCGSCVRRIQALLGEHGARPCPTSRLAARLGLAEPERTDGARPGVEWPGVEREAA
ncbi:bacterioferritin-associated ferredoxin [Kitasatospora sp. NBC_01539]|uniref:(2Fe-2S)-binding protein n=1 Tax=Kitasatospora sp. NBC_01539 TaxID=2903577 RepID=UPI00386012D7